MFPVGGRVGIGSEGGACRGVDHADLRAQEAEPPRDRGHVERGAGDLGGDDREVFGVADRLEAQAGELPLARSR